MPHFEKSLAAEPLVHAENGVLIHGQLASQLAHGRQPIAWIHAARGTKCGNLISDLSRNRDG
jgi:hypothetical protein